MKSQQIILSLSLLLALNLASGCGQSTTSPGSLPTTEPTLPASSDTPTLTSTLVLKNTPTIIPTLPVEQAHSKLLELLANKDGCHLPCLWGITPGKSTYQDAYAILTPLSSLSEFTDLFPSPGAIDPTYTEGDLGLYTNLRFTYSDDGIVRNIYFRAREEKKIVAPNGEPSFAQIFDSASYGERLRPYMLPQILSEQGIPTTVIISTSASLVTRNGGNIVGGFEIVLLYPDQGVLVHYTTQLQMAGGDVRGCPADAHVELELYPSGHPNSFLDHLAQTKWAALWPVPVNNLYWKPIEKATSMSVEQFYQSFRQPTTKCIETPAKLWPIPEPGGG